MSWDLIKDTITRLVAALDRYDWEQTEAICAEIRESFRREPAPCPENDADRILGRLAGKRRFALMKSMAETMLFAEVRGPKIRKRYAQSLIEEGEFAAAEFVLQSIIADQTPGAEERIEARGLLGRLYKQLYVNPGTFTSPGHVPFLERALSEYWQGFQESKGQSAWNGINVVAVLSRASQDGIATSGYPDPSELAKRLLSALSKPVWAYDVATVLEAHVALGNFEEAFKTANDYVIMPDANAFEIGSTERQLTEVWRVREDPRGDKLTTLLRSELLRKQGGSLTLTRTAMQEATTVRKLEGDLQLQAVLGHDRFQTLMWYRLGLERCDSIARVETRSAAGIGTGWLIDGATLSSKWRGKKLVITNKHVVSPPVDGQPYRPSPDRRALLPGETRLNFQSLNKRLDVGEILWSSKGLEIDATILSVKELPKTAKTLDAGDAPTVKPNDPDRVYVIGHPAGRDIEFSLHDNLIVDCDATRIHYRAPTETGSSGSPVFESQNWQVIALHHAGGENIPKLTGSGSYPANEGIALHAIRKAIEEGA